MKIKLESGAGGYVCGEETTLLNTMEGNRREPRLKPPFPTEKGVFSLPTIINNAETLCNVTYILTHSVKDYKMVGDKDFPGTKLLSVSGHFKMNGIIEIPMGITINDLLDKTKFTPIFVNFSAQTTANQTQDIIDGKLGKRRKGVFGPSPGFKATVFVDDLNMPKKEEYGAQPPIEILRAWMDHQGWYDRLDPTWAFKRIIDIQFICAMGPPGGGKTRITQRYVRHFNMINIVPFNASSLKQIFSSVCDWFLSGFGTSIKKLNDPMVQATIEVYDEVGKILLPTPLKSHYTYNLRDLSKVFQGVSTANGDLMNDASEMIRLWGHECMRVFRDRLINKEDRQLFDEMLERGCKDHFRKDWKSVAGEKGLIFGNFIDPQVDPERRNYIEFTDHEKLSTVMNEYLEDYNNMYPKPMHLVLFMNAIEHCSRIARVIQQPYGNALLVGVGGSGRKSLTTLAVFISDMTLFEIEITKVYGMNEWREDLKTVLRLAGEQCKPTVFLFSDTQIKQEDFVEDIARSLSFPSNNLFTALCSISSPSGVDVPWALI